MRSDTKKNMYAYVRILGYIYEYKCSFDSACPIREEEKGEKMTKKKKKKKET